MLSSFFNPWLLCRQDSPAEEEEEEGEHNGPEARDGLQNPPPALVCGAVVCARAQPVLPVPLVPPLPQTRSPVSPHGEPHDAINALQCHHSFHGTRTSFFLVTTKLAGTQCG